MTTTLVGPPRFHIAPSPILEGWFGVYDSLTEHLAKTRRRVLFRTEAEATRMAESLNRELRRREIAKVCRHRWLAVEIVDGLCGKCQSK